MKIKKTNRSKLNSNYWFVGILGLMLLSFNAYSQQVGIGVDSPHPSSSLEVQSTNSGVLIPRMTAAQRNLISSPAVGLLVFDTDSSCFFFYAVNATWQSLCTFTVADVVDVSVCPELGPDEVPLFTGTEMCESQINDNGTSVGVNTDTPDPSAILDIQSNNQGVSFPNVSLVNITVSNPVTNPVEGLVVYNTNENILGGCGKGFYYWNGTKWVSFSGSNDNSLIYTIDGF